MSPHKPAPTSNTTRLEAFSDGVIAVIITIMVLELKVPQVAGLAGLRRKGRFVGGRLDELPGT